MTTIILTSKLVADVAVGPPNDSIQLPKLVAYAVLAPITPLVRRRAGVGVSAYHKVTLA